MPVVNARMVQNDKNHDELTFELNRKMKNGLNRAQIHIISPIVVQHFRRTKTKNEKWSHRARTLANSFIARLVTKSTLVWYARPLW